MPVDESSQVLSVDVAPTARQAEPSQEKKVPSRRRRQAERARKTVGLQAHAPATGRLRVETSWRRAWLVLASDCDTGLVSREGIDREARSQTGAERLMNSRLNQSARRADW
jgi:hypothetical protein